MRRSEVIEFTQHLQGANVEEAGQYHEWRVPESWINAAVNMYLNTMTDTPGERRCKSVELERNANGDRLFVVKFKKTVFRKIVVP